MLRAAASVEGRGQPEMGGRARQSLYGAYLGTAQALLDAVDAARYAVQAGHEAQVWVRDRSTMARIF